MNTTIIDPMTFADILVVVFLVIICFWLWHGAAFITPKLLSGKYEVKDGKLVHKGMRKEDI